MAGKGSGRKAGSGKPERFVQPTLLMALVDRPSYGYEMAASITEHGFIKGDAPPGMIYRHLRQMEEEGLVSSRWEAEGTGPARRIYSLTDEGREVLEAWVEYMERQATSLMGFVKRYRKAVQE